MANWRGICAFLIGGLACVILAAPNSVPIFEGTDMNVVYLGAADGKQYFAINTAMNWTDAQKYCNDSNMKLASVNTVGQINLWKQAYNNVTFHGTYWTAGRDARSLSQFVWDHDDSSINATVVTIPDSIPPLTTCLSYFSTEESRHFHVNPCERLVNLICEI